MMRSFSASPFRVVALINPAKYWKKLHVTKLVGLRGKTNHLKLVSISAKADGDRLRRSRSSYRFEILVSSFGRQLRKHDSALADMYTIKAKTIS
jgi:hypothetical protein